MCRCRNTQHTCVQCCMQATCRMRHVRRVPRRAHRRRASTSCRPARRQRPQQRPLHPQAPTSRLAAWTTSRRSAGCTSRCEWDAGCRLQGGLQARLQLVPDAVCQLLSCGSCGSIAAVGSMAPGSLLLVSARRPLGVYNTPHPLHPTPTAPTPYAPCILPSALAPAPFLAAGGHLVRSGCPPGAHPRHHTVSAAKHQTAGRPLP